jgi:hypothetical protein
MLARISPNSRRIPPSAVVVRAPRARPCYTLSWHKNSGLSPLQQETSPSQANLAWRGQNSVRYLYTPQHVGVADCSIPGMPKISYAVLSSPKRHHPSDHHETRIRLNLVPSQQLGLGSAFAFAFASAPLLRSRATTLSWCRNRASLSGVVPCGPLAFTSAPFFSSIAATFS